MTVAAKPSVTFSTDVLSDNGLSDQFMDFAAVQASMNALNAQLEPMSPSDLHLRNFLQNSPDTIAATSVVWGTAADGVQLSGPGLGQASDINQLLTNLDNGVAAGAFDTLTVTSGGATTMTISFGAGAWVFSVGGQTLTLSGAMPKTMQQVFDFAQAVEQITEFNGPLNSTLQPVADFMKAYALTGFTLNDGTSNVINLQLGASQVLLEVGGAKLQIDGTMPLTSLGTVVEFAIAHDGQQITKLSELPEVSVNNITLTDKDGRVHVQVQGDIDQLDPLSLSTATVNGTDADDHIGLPIFRASEADVVNINMGGGSDRLELDISDLIHAEDIASTNISMGAGGGALVLTSEWMAVDYSVDLNAGSVTASWTETSSNWNGSEFVQQVNDRQALFNVTDAFNIEVGRNPYFTSGFALETTTQVIGDDADNVVTFGATGNLVEFDGGAGVDVVELHSTKIQGVATAGVARADVQGNVNLQFSDGMLNFEFDAHSGIKIKDVENFVFRTDTGTETVSVKDVAADLGFVVGSSVNDELIGGGGAEQFVTFEGDDVVYADGYLGRFSGDIAGQVYRLYQATLSRAPDAGGFNSWAKKLADGSRELVDVSRGFVESPEFRTVYQDLTDSDFIELLYQNVLGRASDAGGLQSWLNALENGRAREAVVLGFSESQEFRNNTAAEAATYATSTDPASWSDEVYRVYKATFNRGPDVGGFKGWTSALANGSTLDQVISGFTGSQEFINTYGVHLSDTQFVELLYQNVLGRASDAGGLQSWLDALNGGRAREAVVKGFSESREFQLNTADSLKGWMRANMQDDKIHVGAGTNVLSGGVGADTFIFDTTQASTNTVVDLEDWDFVQFKGAGDTATVLNGLTQSGDDVVFSHGAFSVTFNDTTLDMFDDTMVTGLMVPT